MTREFEVLMQMVGAASTGTRLTEIPYGIDWKKLEYLASEQQVQALAGYALRMHPELDCPQEIRERMIDNMRKAAMFNHMRKYAVLQLLSEMNVTGIPTILLKGYAVADCYAVPDCRLSGDVDVLIDTRDEKRVYEYLKKKGFVIEPRSKEGHHSLCYHPQIGCVEVHVRLYGEIVENVWFEKMNDMNNICESTVVEHSLEGNYSTLGYTDHMIFLMLHLIKHFIGGGLSLRMMVDTALFFIKHKDRINSERFWETMRILKYGTVAQTILWGMVRYCGVEAMAIPGLAEECPDQINIVMDDLENGGWLGYNDKRERIKSRCLYERRLMLQGKSELQYLAYMVQHKKDVFLQALFPKREELARNYPCVQKFSVLIPFAWLHRVLFRGRRALKNGAISSYVVTDEKKINEISQKRVEMFIQLGML